MTNAEIEVALRSLAEAINTLSIAVNEAAQRDFSMRAELEALRVISQAFMATLQCEPTFEKEVRVKLKAAVEADRVVTLNSLANDQLLLAREVWIKAPVPSDIHKHIF